MKGLKWMAGTSGLAGAVGATILLPDPAGSVIAAASLLTGGALISLRGERSGKPIIRLAGYSWDEHDFCRGWLISGDTGSGKTRSGLNQIMHQVFKKVPTWGGLCIDDKGVYWETLLAMARHYGREGDLILLRVATGEQPVHRINLIGDRTIPFETFARMIVDTAIALGQNRDQSFFRQQAQTHISKSLEALCVAQLQVSLDNAYQLLLDPRDLENALTKLRALNTNAANALVDHFTHQYLEQPAEQLGGVRGTIFNYLRHFVTPEVAEVFCRDCTFAIGDVNAGKIVCLVMPQKLATERRYLGTFLKQLFYLHVLRRFDVPEALRRQQNLLLLVADEAQHFVTASEEGMSDYNVIDRIREARAAVLMATQSTTSFLPPLGKDKAQVLALNLRNRVIFKSADEEDAKASADYIGKYKKRKTTWTYGQQGASRTVTEEDEFKVPTDELRHLKKHQCIVVHCEKGHRKTVLKPLEADGSVAPWFRRRWL